MSANDRQVGGEHYAQAGVQHWDWARSLPYLEGCATKYIARHQRKNGQEDLLKALHYIQKILEDDYNVKMNFTYAETQDYAVNPDVDQTCACILGEPMSNARCPVHPERRGN